MGRIQRVVAVAAGAGLLGLAASALYGAYVCRLAATEQSAPARVAWAGDSSPAEVAPGRAEQEAETAEELALSPRPAHATALRARSARLDLSREAPDGFLEELGRGITKLGDRRFAVARGTLELALAHLGWLSRAARVAPELREGKPFGFRLVWVKTDGPFAKLGLRHEDVLLAINGCEISTADQVLDAYGKLKGARLLALGLMRDGRQSTLEYVIR